MAIMGETRADGMRLVEYIANQLLRVGSHGRTREELVAVGTEGLARAEEKFDPDRGLAFSTFAAPHIRGAMIDSMRRPNPTGEN